jgi:hypothetical protein
MWRDGEGHLTEFLAGVVAEILCGRARRCRAPLRVWRAIFTDANAHGL